MSKMLSNSKKNTKPYDRTSIKGKAIAFLDALMGPTIGTAPEKEKPKYKSVYHEMLGVASTEDSDSIAPVLATPFATPVTSAFFLEEKTMSFPYATLLKVRCIIDADPEEFRTARRRLQETATVIFKDKPEMEEEFSGMYGLDDENEEFEFYSETPLIWSDSHEKDILRNNVRWLPVLVSYETEDLREEHENDNFDQVLDTIELAIGSTYGHSWYILYDKIREDSENITRLGKADGEKFHKSICHVHL